MHAYPISGAAVKIWDTMVIGILFVSTTVSWLILHQVVKRRFAGLKSDLPTIHNSAIAAPPDEASRPALVALCIDLLRKQHCTTPFAELSPSEQQMVLHAHALEVLPAWMTRYAALGLSPANRAVIHQLRQVQSSRPQAKQEHFGAVKALLRSREES